MPNNKVKQAIRFALNNMRSQNDHHPFERLCFDLTKQKICSNIIPSTGPVSAYGDMGIDFQTFKGCVEYGFISDQKMIFACSMQQDGLESKIKDDAGKIHKNFPDIKSIYYFCEKNIPIGKQEAIKQDVKDNLEIVLEILDGEGITSLLSDYDLYWIAEQYLGIPSELYPKPNRNEWYEEYRNKWDKLAPISAKDFLDVKCALRRATFLKELKIDLPFWISKMEEYAHRPDLDDLIRKANYEVLVATLRGKNDIIKFDELAVKYFDNFRIESDSSIEDAICLTVYAIGARKFGSKISDNIIDTWKSEILSKLLGKDENPYLSYLKCHLESFTTLLFKDEIPDEERANKFLTSWIELVRKNEHHPMFPISKLSDLVDAFIDMPFLSDNDLYLTLTSKVDGLNAKRYGDSIAAEKCRDRAIKFYKNNQYQKAIQQLHTTKIKWFQDKTIYGSMLSTIMLGKCYQKIGLTYASKYHYMLAANISLKKDDVSLNKNLPKCLYLLACNDYLNGNWIKFFDILTRYFCSFYSFEKTGLNLDTEEQQHLICYASLINYLGSFEENYKLPIQSIIKKLECDDELKEILLDDLFDQIKKNNKGFAHYWEESQRALSGRPFSDAGETFSIEFNTSGINWKINTENNWDNTIITEEFTSLTQIFLLELYGKDLNHIKGDIVINITPSDDMKATIVEKPGNEFFEYECFIPNLSKEITGPDVPEYLISILSCLTVILDGFSLLKKEDVLNLLEDLFKLQIFNKFFFVGLYRTIYTNLYRKDFFHKTSPEKLNKFKSELSFSSETEIKLFQYDKTYSNFDKEKAEKTIKSRYDNSYEILNLLLPKLNEKNVFQENIKSLKEMGFLDWEIMSSLAGIMLNVKVNEKILELGIEEGQDSHEIQRIAQNIISNPKTHNLPPNNLSSFLDKEKILMGIKMNYMHELKLWNLQIKCQTPKFDSIKDFLEKRCMLGSVDVDHPNYFKK